MMTGFDYDTHIAQNINPGSEEDCCSGSHFCSGLRFSNSDNYGLIGDCYHQSQCSNETASASNIPRVYISDEELYQALNLSPIHSRLCNQSSKYSTKTAETPIDNSASNIPRVCISDEELYQALNLRPIQSSLGNQKSTYSPQTSETPIDNSASNILPVHDNLMSPHEEKFYLPSNIIESMRDPCYESSSASFLSYAVVPSTSTTNTEEEDREVERINTSRATQNHIADDIDVFLHCRTSDNEFLSSGENSRETSQTESNPTPSSRPAYAKKLSSSSQISSIQRNSTSATSPLFLQTNLDPTGFTPLLTPNSGALLQRKLHESQFLDSKSHTATTSEAFYDLNSYTCHKYPLVPSSPIKEKRTFGSLPTPYEHFQQGTTSTFSDNLGCSSSRLQPGSVKEYSVASCRKPLFDVKAPFFTKDAPLDDRSKAISTNDAKKSIHQPEISELSKPAHKIIPLRELLLRYSNSSPESLESEKKGSKNLSRMPDKSDVVLDDWETADDEHLAQRMEKLMKNVQMDMKKEEEKAHTFNADPPTCSDWDPNSFSNVLEIYDIPEYKMEDDVVKSLEVIGYGDCTVKWIERKIVFARFESASRAKSCLLLPGHDWLRFRKLKNSPKFVRDAALANEAILVSSKIRGKTNASVARRMVENVLGKKSTASEERRREERKQLADARAAKMKSVKWD